MKRLIIICVTVIMVAGIFGWMFRWEYHCNRGGYLTHRVHRITGDVQRLYGRNTWR